MSESDWFIFGVLSAIAIVLIFIWWQSRLIANRLQNNTSLQELNIQQGIRSTRRSNWLIYIWFFIGSAAIIAALFVLPAKNNSGHSGDVVITVLSIFVTFLVAWQIWQTMISRDELKEVNDIKNEYQRQIGLLKEQDARNFCLIEAFELRRDAQTAPNNTKYELTLRSIRQFLKAYTTSNYAYLLVLVNSLDVILSEIAKSPQKALEQFNAKRDELDNLYDEITTELNRRINETKELKERIRAAHRTRHKIHNP